jgi:hypothetical protein
MLKALLDGSASENPDYENNKAKVANMLVICGLEYLRSSSKLYLRRKEDQEIDDAIELSKQLTFNLLSDKEKHSIIWKEIMEKNRKTKEGIVE